jgi:DUF4097 and DUF4098 domain-containing protein YvlB
MKKQFSIAAILLLTTFLAFSVSAQKEVSKAFKGIKSIRMNTASGSCKIVKSTDASVTVNIIHGYEEGVFEPIFEQNGDRLELREDYHARSVSGSSPRWTLTIPEEVEVRFRTGSGDIEASNMKLRLDATTGSGNVAFRKVTGDINVNTGSGDFDLEEVDGIIDANTGSGTARISNSRGQLKISCGSGVIRITDSQGEFRANTGSGDVIGRNITLTGSSKFNSGSGDAQVVLGGALKYDISVGSGSGNAELNFNGNEIAGEIIMMANKTNGRIIAPFDFANVEESTQWGDQVTVKKTVMKGSATQRVSVSTGSGEATLRK